MNYDKFIPPPVVYDHMQYNNPITKQDAIDILQFEIDLSEEGDDGALSAADIKKVRKALAKIKQTEAVR